MPDIEKRLKIILYLFPIKVKELLEFTGILLWLVQKRQNAIAAYSLDFHL